MKWLRRIRATLWLKWHRLRNMKLISVIHVGLPNGANGDYDHSTIYLHSFFNSYDNFLAIDYTKDNVWVRGDKPLNWQVTGEVMEGDAKSIKHN